MLHYRYYILSTILYYILYTILYYTIFDIIYIIYIYNIDIFIILYYVITLHYS